MAFQTEQQRNEQIAAELALYPQAEGYTYGAGFVGGHQSVGSWFTSGITGLILSKGASDNEQRDWYVQRNGIQFGKQALEDRLKAYKEVSKFRKLTSEEEKDREEASRRDILMSRDLEYVFNKKRGNLDAPMDSKGQSFNERWGVAPEDEQGILDMIKVLKDNPAYTGGVFTAEILKDLPLSVLAWLGLTAKGAAGASSITKALNKLNNIQPAALRGLSKMGTGIGTGAIAGASYEGLYTQLEQGEIKGKEVKAGATFGAAFGVLAGLGIMARTSKDLASKAKPKETTTVTKEETDLKEITEMKEVLPPKEVSTEQSIISDIKNQPNRLYPEIKEDRDYVLVDLATDKGRKIANDNGWLVKGGALQGFKGAQTIDVNGMPHIVVHKGRRKQVFDRFQERFETTVSKSGRYDRLTPHQKTLLDNEDSWDVMLQAREKGKIELVRREQEELANGQPVTYEPGAREKRLNALVAEELERAYNQRADELLTPSDRNINDVKEDMAANLNNPDEIPVNATEGVASRVTGFFENKSKALPIAAAGAAVGAYALTGEEGDPLQSAIAAGLVVGLGPKGYRALAGKSLNVVSMRIKAQIAKSLEESGEMVKIWEAKAQRIMDDLDKLSPERVMILINRIEGKTKDDNGKSLPQLNTEELKLKEELESLLNIIGTEAVDVGLLLEKGTVIKLNMKGMGVKERGAFLNNYFPHLFVNINKLTDEDIAKIFGRINSGSENRRTINGTLAEIQQMIDDGEITTSLQLLSPKDAINVYVQGMSRAIVGRRAINAMRTLDLGTPEGGFTKGQKGMRMPALLTIEDLDILTKGKGGLSTQQSLQYMKFDHPGLEGFVAHTNIHGVLNDFFAVSRRGGIGDIAEKILKLNNGLKRVFVFGSLFHAQALFMSSIYSLGLVGAIKGAVGKGKTGNVDWAQMQLGSNEFAELAQQAMKDGLQIVNIRKQELVNPGKPQVDFIIEKLGPGGKIMGKAFDAIDTITWEYLHDRFKLGVYLRHKERLEKSGVDPKRAGQDAAEFANDAFGSLDWNNFTTRLYDYAAANPSKIRGKVANRLAQLLPANKRRWLNLGLFAPDWTISNIRIIAKTFTGLPSVSKAKLKQWQKGDWESPEAKAMVKAWNMYAAYSLRAGVYTTAMWWAMMEAFSNEEPTMEGLADFWTGENSGKLDLGDGESMVISKQIAEPIHWVQHPMHTFMNKTSVVPKTALEAMFNKQWFSLKKGMPLGPRIVEEDGTQHYAKWLLGKTVPIVSKSLMDSDLGWEERVERVFTGFFGFPQYGDPED